MVDRSRVYVHVTVGFGPAVSLPAAKIDLTRAVSVLFMVVRFWGLSTCISSGRAGNGVKEHVRYGDSWDGRNRYHKDLGSRAYTQLVGKNGARHMQL